MDDGSEGKEGEVDRKERGQGRSDKEMGRGSQEWRDEEGDGIQRGLGQLCRGTSASGVPGDGRAYLSSFFDFESEKLKHVDLLVGVFETLPLSCVARSIKSTNRPA